MKKLRTACVATLLLLAASVPAFAAKKTTTIKVVNQSKWEIHHLFLSSTTDHEWGPDQLGDDVISSGESFTLTDVECDKYDIRVVDEDGDECVVENVKLCGEETVWKITDKILLSCEGHT